MQTHNTADNISAPLTELNSAAEQTARRVLEKTRNATSHALEVASVKMERGQEIFNKGAQRSVDLLRRYPVESAVACLGAGFLVGKFLNRKN